MSATTGRDVEAEQHLGDRVFNRRDDDLPPIDLPERTARVSDDKAWRARRECRRRTG